jgi:hypothetical protein
MKNIKNIDSGQRNDKRGKSLIILIAICFVLYTAGTVWASIEASPHNPSPDNCRICHTKHSVEGQISSWDKHSKAMSFTGYDREENQNSEALESQKAKNSAAGDLDHSSKVQTESSKCLVCHNGIFGSIIKSSETEKNETYDFESDPDFWKMADKDHGPSHNHPCGFTFDPKKDSGNNGFPEAVTISGDTETKVIIGRKSGTQYPLFGSGQNKFECLTCHTAHYSNANQNIKGTYQVKMLRADNTISSMCRDCHPNKY